MEYSEKTFVAIIQAHPSVLNEIEARDAVFRLDFDDDKRRQIASWNMLGRQALQQEEFDVWLSLHAAELSEREAVEKISELMARYYGKNYPLR